MAKDIQLKELAAQILLENPDVSKRRLATLLFTKHPGNFNSVEQARNAIRYASGTMGSTKRQNAIVKDMPRKGAKVYAMPKSKAEPWTPHNCNGSCIAIFSDCHFPVHDPEAIEAAVAHVKENFEPDTVLLNGDFADALEFGAWAKSPKAIDTENALQVVREGLLYFRSQFPDAQLIYKMGNHEDRLERFCWEKAPELVGLPHITWKGLLTIDNDLNKVEELDNIFWIGEEKPIITGGGLAIFHGHELPRGLTNAVNPARGAFLRTRASVLIGHHHQSSSHVEYDWKKEPVNCWSVGCLADMNPRYARINKYNLGHAVVEATKNSFNVSNFKQLSGNKIVRA